jgi:hypothetical protein
VENEKIDLSNISEEELLNLRICNLPLSIEGTWLADCVKKLYGELESKGMRFTPPCYLADEWLTPEGEPAVGIPFFLAHPALMKLEKRMMFEVEGGNKEWCMKLLRHETGHAINYAYKLYKRRKWRQIFGSFSKEYGDTYRFRPYSKNFVRHLEDYYAQYHPDEDFAETFAVWLTPDIDWKVQYKSWKALDKLQYVDELIEEIKEKEPLVKKGKQYWHASSRKIILKNFYKKKRYYHEEDFPDFHDVNLKKIFAEKRKENAHLPAAHILIRMYKKNIINSVSAWTGEKKYIIDDLLKILLKRCRELRLVVGDSETVALLRVSIYITTLITNYMYTGTLGGEK